MNFIDFKSKTKAILQHRKQSEVDEFYSLMKKSIFFDGCLDTLKSLDKSYYLSPEEQSKYEKALSAITYLIDFQIEESVEVFKDFSTVEAAGLRIKLKLLDNFIFNTGGNRGFLTRLDLYRLRKLRRIFKKAFPNSSHVYKRNNLLTKIGEVLLEKTIPKSIEKQMNKYNLAAMQFGIDLKFFSSPKNSRFHLDKLLSQVEKDANEIIPMFFKDFEEH